MGAFLVAPASFSIVSENTDAGSFAINMNNDYPAMVWRSSTSTAVRFVIDLGANPLTYDTVILAGTNLKAADTVQIRTGTDTTGVGSSANNGVAWTGVKAPTATAKVIRRLPAPRSERYMRIDITSTVPVVEVSRFIVGSALTFKGLEARAEIGGIDDSVITSGPGYEEIDPVSVRQKIKFTAPAIVQTDFYTNWYPFVLDRGTSKGVFFQSDDVGAFPQMTSLYGRFSQLPAPKQSGTLFSVDATVTAFAP